MMSDRYLPLILLSHELAPNLLAVDSNMTSSWRKLSTGINKLAIGRRLECWRHDVRVVADVDTAC